MPRGLEVLLALCGLIILSPLFTFGILAVGLSSRGPILYRQERIGLRGRKFILYKFRSMKMMPSDTEFTARDDVRITRAGRFLRKTKIDELPELWNVVKGDMSFVGPRPEVPRYVDLESALWKQVLAARPGITDPVSLSLRNEEELLGEVKGDRQAFYLHTLQPLKLEEYAGYLRRRTFWSDVKIILRTLVVVIFPGKAPRSRFDNLIPPKNSEWPDSTCRQARNERWKGQ